MVAELEIKNVARLIAVYVIQPQIQRARRDSGELFLMSITKTTKYMKENYLVDEKGFYGEFGGAYVPEILYKCVHDLQDA